MLNDFYPIRIVAPQLHYFDGVFYFMKTIYKTHTTVLKDFCVIDIYRDHECWFTYDFHLDELYFINGRNIFTELQDKRWGTPENIEEIHNAITKHLLANNHV
jgi:hypothetical protein